MSSIIRNDDAIEYALREAHDNDVKFIRLWFTDILGTIKGFAITIDELENSLNRGMGFDGSAIEGYARSDERDLYALPDPTTFSILPWRPRTNAVARMFCDIVTPEDKYFDGDPREVLRQNLKRASDKGFTYYVSPELEYFYFKDSDNTKLLDSSGYFDQENSDLGTDLRRETVLTLEELGIPVASSHHEAAPSQHEIDLQYTDALTMADSVMTLRLAVKKIAIDRGVYATFMPKPLNGVQGSGMHTHLSLFSQGKNVFHDPSGSLSATGQSFVAGLLYHAREITAITNQLVNSYKRINEGYEAPRYVSWARNNRSSLVRIPVHKQDKPDSARIEYRAVDPACNPYLAFSVMLSAGLKGIEENYELPPEATTNLYEMSRAEQKELGVASLPANLSEALDEMEASELVREALGDHIFEWFLRNKRTEWNEYQRQVTPFEIDQYLPNW